MLMVIFADKFLKDNTIKSSPLTLVYGEDCYLREVVVKKARSLCEADKTEFVSLYGDETTAQELFATLEGFSFLYPQKFVVLHYFNKMSSKSDKDKVLEYLWQGLPQGIVLVITADKFDKRNKDCAKLCKKFPAINCKKPYGVGDVIKYLQSTKLQFTNDALQAFARSVELDYAQISKECEKLFVLFGNKKSIKEADVKTYLLGFREHSVFELQNCLGQRRCGKALEYLDQLMSSGTAGVMVVGVLYRFYSSLYKVVALRGQHTDAEIAADYLPEVHSFFRKDYLAYGKKYNKKEVLQIFGLLHNADCLLKSSPLPAKVVLRSTIVRVCRRIR